MDGLLTEEQQLLLETASTYVRRHLPRDRVRSLIGTSPGHPARYLEDTARLGWYAALVAEEYGGGSVSGQPVRELGVLAEARGRNLQPGPFLDMNVAAFALGRAGSAAQKSALLPGIAAGEVAMAWVVDVDQRSPSGASPRVHRDGTGYVIDGRWPAVGDVATADWILVTAVDEHHHPCQFLVEASAPGLAVEPLESLDLTRRFGSLVLDAVRVDHDARLEGDAAVELERQLDLASALLAADTVGAMRELFESTRQYALDRIAFGRPIGSFQAVKHQLADLSLRVEASAAVVTAAAASLDDGWPEAAEVASIAKAWVSDAGVEVAQGCMQIFGGIGFTWEHDCHLFLRRIAMNALLFGDAAWHRERVCRLHGI